MPVAVPPLAAAHKIEGQSSHVLRADGGLGLVVRVWDHAAAVGAEMLEPREVQEWDGAPLRGCTSQSKALSERLWDGKCSAAASRVALVS